MWNQYFYKYVWGGWSRIQNKWKLRLDCKNQKRSTVSEVKKVCRSIKNEIVSDLGSILGEFIKNGINTFLLNKKTISKMDPHIEIEIAKLEKSKKLCQVSNVADNDNW